MTWAELFVALLHAVAAVGAATAAVISALNRRTLKENGHNHDGDEVSPRRNGEG